MRPGDCCAVAVFQWWDSYGERRRRPDVRFVARELHRSMQGQCRVSAGEGAGVRGAGEACTSQAHEGNNSHPPPLSMGMLLGRPCVLLAYIISFFFFLQKQGNHSRHCRRVQRRRHSVGIPMYRLYTPAPETSKGDGAVATVGPGTPSWLIPCRGGQPARGFVQAGRRCFGQRCQRHPPRSVRLMLSQAQANSASNGDRPSSLRPPSSYPSPSRRESCLGTPPVPAAHPRGGACPDAPPLPPTLPFAR